MNFERQTTIVAIASFLSILLIGMYLTYSESGGYMFSLGRGKGGGSAPYYLDGRSVIFIALVYGAIMLYALLFGQKKK